MDFNIGFISTKKGLYSTILYLLFSSVTLIGQTYRFRNYNADNGLPNKFVYSINQDNKGFIWVGTGSGLARFDGIDFYNVPFPDSISTPYPVVTVKDKSGTLWFGFSDGSLFYSVNESIAKVDGVNAQKINDLFSASDGFIYVVSENQKIFRVDPEKHVIVNTLSVDTDLALYSARMISDGAFLVGTQENLLYCKAENDSLLVERVVTGIDYSKVQSVFQIKGGNSWLIATEENGIYIYNDQKVGNSVLKLEGFPTLENLRIQSVADDQEGTIWISTYGYGVLKLKLSADNSKVEGLQIFDNKSGLSGNNNVKYVFSGHRREYVDWPLWRRFITSGFGCLHLFYSGGQSGNE